MKIILQPRDGFLVQLTMRILGMFAIPLDYLHESLKIPINSILKKVLTKWTEKDIEGLYIELWVLLWTIVNIFILLRGLWLINTWYWYLLLAILILRAFDFLRSFLAMNLELSNYQQRSLARSYAMLFLAFLEVGAITSSIQAIICRDFVIGGEKANWANVFYYSLRNMVTVGGGDIMLYSSCPKSNSFLFGVIRIVQPLFSLLLVTLAISKILNYKNVSTASNSKPMS